MQDLKKLLKSKTFIIAILLFFLVIVMFVIVYFKTLKGMDDRAPKNDVNKDLIMKFDDKKQDGGKDIKPSESDKSNETNKTEDNHDANTNKNDDENTESNKKNENNINTEKKDENNKLTENTEDKNNSSNTNSNIKTNDKQDGESKPNDENKHNENVETDKKNESSNKVYMTEPNLGSIIDNWYVWPSLFENMESAKSFADNYLFNIKHIDIDGKRYYIKEYKYDVVRYTDNTVAGARVQFKLDK